ncbi:6,7-dimethyl-8-ribityllumazine synthase [Synechococcus sp. PCC 7502]|uniref:6,7-dimethyl-8-ribityllumazine synthase n=1 Tax=Synechococcus sp. PCC 7502 TaxID=1173263 RepID=UPI00029FF74E|nr:6,7-dimethyl-8-ribityllumazine synthase [Synechococcus sp. PCC 7502]AFY74371.1 6,7-dimethyl-8-ribityllumazine synthase [Synechococcus sp. PCC 7502]
MTVFEGSFTHTADLKFAIVAGRFNDLIMTRLLQGCQDALQRHGINIVSGDRRGQVDYAWVPGSFEIPLVARELAATGRYNAVICLGAIIRGDTPHFDYVAAEVSKGIANASIQTGVPVIFGIITADTMQQALERAGIKSNKGWDYAMNAIEMASLMSQIRQNHPSLLGEADAETGTISTSVIEAST